ncbi:hypothetical protein KUTeg_019166 [Tegillarca granosa]|uniref:Uncharacterized protein n=1 Tax=Tegillarca granosa TaxID=220873 RepID=A0ABQ9EGW2_TEGGR|nr:hypothetical protein KUTeg_019166 [Tegillarca granosa]
MEDILLLCLITSKSSGLQGQPAMVTHQQGLGGTPAQVGFNAGDGVNFYALNTSRTAKILNIASESNVATPGRFMFRIDTEKIEDGGCNTGVNIANTNPLLIRSNPKRWKFGDTVELTWDQQQIPFSHQYVKLDIFYIILKEQTFELDWLHGGTVFPNISVDQQRASFQFLPRIYVGLFRLSPANGTDVWHTEAAWSDVFPVVPPSNTVSRTLCSVWYTSDKKLQAVSNDDSPPCPCTLNQALLDTGRFHRDPLCNSFTTGDTISLNCIHHGSADHCVRLNVLGSRGTGRLCCYDKTGNLMDARKLDGGGTVHRHHYFGSDGNIPFLSNFYFDIVPYLQCCVYQNETGNGGGQIRPLSLTANDMTTNIVGDTCPKFFERRPASDCKGYVPPRPARGNGDPHIKTLDGLPYTFNGAGEYVFIRDVDRNFTAQVRMEAVMINVEVRLNSIRVADVYLNGEPVDFHDARSLDIRGGSLFLLQEQVNNTKEFLVRFTKPLIAFSVKATADLINIITCLSDPELKGKVEGLLGNNDGNPDNDLQDDNGTVIAAMSPLRQIHYQFGEKFTSCGLPPDISNGQWNATGYTAGSKASLTCATGYIPVVSAEIVCGNDGLWDSKNVKCVPNTSGQDRLRLSLPMTIFVAFLLKFVTPDYL